jgi:hypothetical protein
MPSYRGRFPGRTTERALLVATAGLLLCLLALSGCTQPVIPSPTPTQTTPPPVVTTKAATALPTTMVQVSRGVEYATYTNPQYGFSISYPVGWAKVEGTGGTVVTFTSPSTGMGDIPATMKVLVEDLSANPMSPEQYKNALFARKRGLQNFNVIDDKPEKGSGYTGWKFGYTYEAGSLIKTFDIYAIRGTTAYTVSFSSKSDKSETFSVPMDAMFKSFQFTG